MVIEYEKDYLQELYESGVCKNKKYRFQKQVVQKYQKRIDTLMAATRMEDLFVFNSLNFEALVLHRISWVLLPLQCQSVAF